MCIKAVSFCYLFCFNFVSTFRGTSYGQQQFLKSLFKYEYRHWHQFDFDFGCLRLLCIIKTAAKLFKQQTSNIFGNGNESKYLAKRSTRLIGLIFCVSTCNNNMVRQITKSMYETFKDSLIYHKDG